MLAVSFQDLNRRPGRPLGSGLVTRSQLRPGRHGPSQGVPRCSADPARAAGSPYSCSAASFCSRACGLCAASSSMAVHCRHANSRELGRKYIQAVFTRLIATSLKNPNALLQLILTSSFNNLIETPPQLTYQTSTRRYVCIQFR